MDLLTLIIVILVVAWALGMVGGYAFGGLLHLLLVIAIIVLIVRLLQGRRAL